MEPIKLTGYVAANTGFITNASSDIMVTSNIGLGAKIEKNDYYGKAEAGYEKVTYAKVELGKNFKLSDNNLKLNTSVGGQYTVENKKRDYYKNIFAEGGNSPTWKTNDTRGYGQLALLYDAPVFKAQIGVRAGIKTSTQASLDGITLAKVGEIVDTEYAGRTTKWYATPTIYIEAGKHVKFGLHLATDELSVGAKYYF